MVIFKADGVDHKYKRCSRWIQIQYKYITPKHRLYCYAENNDDCLVYFRHNGRMYALGEIMRFNPPIEITNGKEKVVLSGYDATDYWRPRLVEVSSDGEAVRLYTYAEEERIEE